MGYTSRNIEDSCTEDYFNCEGLAQEVTEENFSVLSTELVIFW